MLRYNADPSCGPERLAHLTAAEYVDYGYLTSELFDKYFKFAFVRNPWTRLVSEYTYRGYDRKSEFKTFVKSLLPRQSKYSDTYRHILPQHEFIYDSSGNCLVDFVGRFEDLNNGFSTVCSRLGIGESSLPRVNASNMSHGRLRWFKDILFQRKTARRMHYTDYYDAVTMQRVGEMYARDIELFQYKYGE